MKKNNVFKRCLSGLLAISVITSCLWVGLGYVFAAPGSTLVYDGNVTDLGSSYAITISGNNISSNKTNQLIGAEYDVFSFTDGTGDARTVHSANLEQAADATLNNVDVSSSNAAVNFVWDMKKYVDASEFYMVGRSEKNLQTFEYKVYAGETHADVMSEDNLVAHYKRNDTKDTDHRVNIFTLSGVTKVRYLRVYFIDGNYDVDNSFRFCDVGLLGTKNSDLDSDAVIVDNKTAVPTDKAVKAMSCEVFANGNKATGHSLENLQDNNGTNEASVATTFADRDAGTGAVTWKTDGSRYVDVVYNMGNGIDMEKAVIIHNGNKYLMTGRYELYAAGSSADLFKASNKIASFENAGCARRQIFNFSTPIKAKFVGMRIYDPVTDHGTVNVTKVTEGTNNIYPRLSEFRIYGEAQKSYKQGVELEYDGDLTDGCSPLFSLSGNNITTAAPNILTGKTPDATAYHDTGDPKTVKYADIDRLNDGVANLSSDIYNAPEIDLIYQLKDTYTLSNFVMLNRDEKNLQTVSYALYASDTYQGLSKDSAWLGTYTNPGNGQCNVIKFTDLDGIKYFKIKLIDGNPELDSTFRICELMLFGNKTGNAEKTVLTEDDSTVIPEYSSNLVLKSTNYLGRASDYKAEGSVAVFSPEALTDGKIDGSEFSAGPRYALWDADKAEPVWYTDGEKVYVKIIYDFGDTADISNVLVVNHHNKYLRTGHYKLYIGDDLETLFEDSNLKYEYKNEGMLRRQLYSFSGENAAAGRYVAIKIDCPVSDKGNVDMTKVTENLAKNNIYPRLNEFAVWGEYQDKNYLNRPIVESIWEKASGKPMFSNADLKGLGTSLIAGQKADAKLKFITANATVFSRLAWLTDGNVENIKQAWGGMSIHTDLDAPKVTDGSEPLDLIYKLGDGETPYDLSKVFYLGLGDCGESYITGHYQVFASVDYDDLFSPESMVFEYDYKKDGFARGHIINFKNGFYPRACYFAVRILNPVTNATDWVYARVTEIGVYGTKANIVAKPTNLANNMPVNAYLSDNGENIKEVSSKKFGYADSKKLTDSKSTTYVSFSKKDKQLDIIYNLCGEMNIDKINVISADSANVIKNFKIYASTDLNGVWGKDALVYTAKNSSKITDGITFAKSKKMRYVRISFPEADDSVRVADIEVIGLDNQEFKFKNLAPTLNSTDISFYTQDNKTKSINYLTLEEAQASGLVNRDKKTSCTVWGGKDGKSSLNIQMYFPDLKNISSIESYFIDRHTDYWPVGMKIYIGETQGDVMDDDAKPVIVFDEKPKDGKYLAEFLPRLARYIRFEIPENNPGLSDIYEEITVAFTEIVINGTGVRGLQRSDEDDYLLKWRDEKTGIEWEIVRLDKNDIYTEIAESRLISTKPTLTQKSSLNQYPYYKIVGDKIYEIEFLDIFGNKITDFNTRLLRVKMPIKKAHSDGQALLGIAYDRKNLELYETSYTTVGKKTFAVSTFDYEIDSNFLFANTLLTDEDDSFWKGVPVAGTLSEPEQENNTDTAPDYNDTGKLEDSENDYFEDGLIGGTVNTDGTVTAPDGTIIIPGDLNPATGENSMIYVVVALLLAALGLAALTRGQHTEDTEK